MSQIEEFLVGGRRTVTELFPRRFDWALAGGVLVLSLIGVASIASAVGPEKVALVYRQLTALGVGLALMLILVRIDYRMLVEVSAWMYIATLFVLVGLLLFAPRIAGTKAWVRFGGIQVQPSEFALVTTILLLAHLFDNYDQSTLDPGAFFRIALVTALPMGLVFLQNDLGMASTFVAVGGAALFLGGLHFRVWIFMTVAAIIVLSAIFVFGLHDYQKKRIQTFLDPGADSRGAGYQVLQSKIAVGSGGVVGKGYRRGTQSGLGFLPARHTDFIFAVIAEELGLLGVAGTLSLLAFVLLRLLGIARRARDRAGAFICAAVAALLAFHVFINAGMLVGLVPTTGITMPFLSYGGSSLVANFIAIGLALSVEYRRFANA